MSARHGESGVRPFVGGFSVAMRSVRPDPEVHARCRSDHRVERGGQAYAPTNRPVDQARRRGAVQRGRAALTLQAGEGGWAGERRVRKESRAKWTQAEEDAAVL